MPDAHATLAELFRALDVHVTCSNPKCWRHGGVLDGPAFIARYGADHPSKAVLRRLRCLKCGAAGSVSLVHALNSIGERIEGPPWPRILPPPR